MVGWHHRLGGREFEQAPGVGYGQGNLACCSPWGCKELDTTESLNRTELNWGKEEATLGRGNSLNKILETGQFRAHSTAGVLGLDCDRAFPHILACHPCSSSTFSLFLSSLFLSSFFLSLAIPWFGLIDQVNSLRLSSGHSGLVLTLSNAACASLLSPHLLVVDVSIWATSSLGVAVRHIICGFC